MSNLVPSPKYQELYFAVANEASRADPGAIAYPILTGQDTGAVFLEHSESSGIPSQMLVIENNEIVRSEDYGERGKRSGWIQS